MTLDILGVHSFDVNDPIKRGVVAEELVGTSMGVSLRRVTYQDTETGTVYTYLTDLPVSVPPGIVEYLLFSP